MNTHHKLTEREIEILNLFSKGKTTPQCSKELNISEYTVEAHRRSIHKKLGSHHIAHAIDIARNKNII